MPGTASPLPDDPGPGGDGSGGGGGGSGGGGCPDAAASSGLGVGDFQGSHLRSPDGLHASALLAAEGGEGVRGGLGLGRGVHGGGEGGAAGAEQWLGTQPGLGMFPGTTSPLRLGGSRYRPYSPGSHEFGAPGGTGEGSAGQSFSGGSAGGAGETGGSRSGIAPGRGSPGRLRAALGGEQREPPVRPERGTGILRMGPRSDLLAPAGAEQRTVGPPPPPWGIRGPARG